MAGDRTNRTLNSFFEPRRTTEGSLADINTCPTALRSHWTLERIQLVRALKRSLNVDLARVPAQVLGEKMQRKWLTT
jgi:hypothetical protein